MISLLSCVTSLSCLCSLVSSWERERARALDFCRMPLGSNFSSQPNCQQGTAHFFHIEPRVITEMIDWKLTSLTPMDYYIDCALTPSAITRFPSQWISLSCTFWGNDLAKQVHLGKMTWLIDYKPYLSDLYNFKLLKFLMTLVFRTEAAWRFWLLTVINLLQIVFPMAVFLHIRLQVVLSVCGLF